MPGRHPKPTAEKRRTGNPGKHPLNEREPEPVLGMPTCPSHVTGAARTEWRRLGAEMVAEQRMAVIYRPAFAAYCVAYGRWVEAEIGLRKTGLVYKAKNGYTSASPYLAIANTAWTMTVKALGELGLSPVSQAKVSTVGTPSSEVDPTHDFSEFMLRKQRRAGKA